MGVTVPDGIPYPDSSWTGGFKLAVSLLADSVQSLLVQRRRKSYSWPSQTQRTAQTGMVVDDMGYQSDTDSSYRFDGSNWILWNMSRRAYTPVVATGTLGNGSLANSMYQVVEGRVFGRVAFVLGSTSNPANLSFQAPIPVPGAQGVNSPVGQAVYFDISSGARHGGPVLVQGQNLQPFRHASSSTPGFYNALTATAPFTWANGDRILLEYNYPLA